ncbi:helicase HerA domain-containing protein [Methylobacillus glycogenes]|uniref:helicase HerA domain-containing protein n=1 Tax=Methylobacillus glycogenes TaxID=406 RepID=UPI00046EA8D9|nr:DUF87 domain-containing protein [Methylobacillus glycogenes]
MLLIQPNDIVPEFWLGPLVEVNHDRVLLLVSSKTLQAHDLMARGAQVYMLNCSGKVTLETPPKAAMLDAKRPIVLRVLAYKPWPEPGSAQDKRLEMLLTADKRSDEWVLMECRILGMFFHAPSSNSGVGFAGDVGQLAHVDHYQAFVPTTRVRHLFVNGTVDKRQRIRFGLLRDGETLDYQHNEGITATLSMLDIRGKRTAMFGKTRLGKSNVVKLLVQGMLDVTNESNDVGQLIFDVNGEYANSNPQDGNENIAAVYPKRCILYYLSEKTASGNSKLLRFNFYERTAEAMDTLRELLPAEVAESDYVRPLLTCRLPILQHASHDGTERAQRRLRKLMVFWTILHAAGFEFDEARLRQQIVSCGYEFPFNPGFIQSLRLAAFQAMNGMAPPPQARTFGEMIDEMLVVLRFSLSYPNDPSLRRDGRFIFDADEEIMAAFLFPQVGAGPYVLRPAVPFHSPSVDDFISEILTAIDKGSTVIVDLGSANERIIRYFAKTLSVAVFLQQESKFVRNEMHGRYVQIYFEEAHMIFPPNSGNVIDVYSRFAKEGAKFNIGIVYSTQSPSTVNHDLLAQTENFFIGHLSSDREVQMLASVQYAFKGMEEDIMRSRTPGFMRVLTASHRFPIPIQANRYDGKSLLLEDKAGKATGS